MPHRSTSYVDRAPRVNLHELRRIALSLDTYPHVRVANLSLTGIAIFQNDLTQIPKPGTLIKGVLTFQPQAKDQKIFRVDLKTAHAAGQILGLAFANQDRDREDAIVKYFEAELIALKLVPVNDQLLKKDEEGNPHLFQFADLGDLYLVEVNNKVQSFEISFLGHYFEWRKGKSQKNESTLMVGDIVDEVQVALQGPGGDSPDPESSDAYYKGSVLIQWNENRHEKSELIPVAVNFVHNIETLNSSWKQQIISILTA
jgi:hypothetical protein